MESRNVSTSKSNRNLNNTRSSRSPASRSTGKKIHLTDSDIVFLNRVVNATLAKNKPLVSVIMKNDNILDWDDLSSELMVRCLHMVDTYGAISKDNAPLFYRGCQNTLTSIARAVQAQRRKPSSAQIVVSLDADVDNGSDDTIFIASVIADPTTLYGQFEDRIIDRIEIQDILKENLTEEEKHLFDLVYVKGYEQRIIAQTLHISQPEVSIRKKALTIKIKELLEAQDLIPCVREKSKIM